jgi:hypothetical protein
MFFFDFGGDRRCVGCWTAFVNDEIVCVEERRGEERREE